MGFLQRARTRTPTSPRFASPRERDDEEADESKHSELLEDVGPGLPLLSLPRDGGVYAYIRHQGSPAPEEHEIHGDPSHARWSPLFRWFLCGGAGSGLGCHQDPNSTMFWNACIVGKKRWCIFPPSTPESLLVSQTLGQPFLPGSDQTPEYHPSASAKAWFEQAQPWPTKSYKSSRLDWAL